MYRLLIIIALMGSISACSGKKINIDTSEATYHPETNEDRRGNDMDSILTKKAGPMVLFSSKKGPIDGSSNASSGNGVGSSYLWRATLESIAFMPLSTVDSNGGVILTDWYSAPSTPNERLKFNILILSSEINISSIKVVAFREVQRFSVWHSAEVAKDLGRVIEDNILRKAIALRAKD